MKILVTGGSGFVGSNIAIYLKNTFKRQKFLVLITFHVEAQFLINKDFQNIKFQIIRLELKILRK